MQEIEYRVLFTGATGAPRGRMTTYNAAGATEETFRVRARNINAGYAKVLRLALEPLGNGDAREIGSLEFSRVL
jgi:hypothetical protein